MWLISEDSVGDFSPSELCPIPALWEVRGSARRGVAPAFFPKGAGCACAWMRLAGSLEGA